MGVTNYYSIGGEIIGERAGTGARTDYLRDALGSVTGTTDSSGAVVNTYRYKPYGAELARTGVGADPKYRWVGTAGYRASGLSHISHYIGLRHYAYPEGRWTTLEPIAFVAANYLYSLNNPTTIIDPTGLFPVVVPVIPESTWRLAICPRVDKPPKGIPQCSGVGKGHCPHQSSSGDYIRFPGFASGDPSKGRPGNPDFDITRCNTDDANFNWGALQVRRDQVEDYILSHCGENPPPDTRPGLPWAKTRACWDLINGKYVITCGIRCFAESYTRINIGFNRNGNKSTIGEGCAMMCLMKHETVHCEQARAGHDDDYLGSQEGECAGWKAELECLDSLLRRKSR